MLSVLSYGCSFVAEFNGCIFIFNEIKFIFNECIFYVQRMHFLYSTKSKFYIQRSNLYLTTLNLYLTNNVFIQRILNLFNKIYEKTKPVWSSKLTHFKF